MLALCCVPPVNAQDDSVPAQRTATVVTRNSVTLIWDDPSDESITHYRISRRDLAIHVPPEFVIIDDNTGSATPSYTDDTVEPGGSYLYRITALNRKDASQWSRYARADIPAASTRNAPPPRDGSVPDRPTGLSTIATFNSIALIWDNPGDSTITGYVILRRNIVEQDPGVFTTVEANTGTVTTSYTDTGVEAETRYAYWIKAINEHGTSPRSGYVNVETPAVTDSDRASVSEGDTDLPNDNTTPGRVMVASAARSYTPTDGDRGKSVNEAGAGEGSDSVKAGPEEEPVLGDGLPGAPRNLTATPGNKEITLSWEPPADNGNAPATRYRIEWRIDGKDYDKNHGGTARSTSYTTTDQANLANGVKYFFRVKAENGSGNSYGPYGPASEEVSATPTSGSAVDLGTPVLSDTENLHHGMVRLDWQDVGDAGWYVVQYYHVEGGEWLDLPAEGVDIAFHGSSAVVSNLHGLSWLRVRAMSCAGESEWSQIVQLFGTNESDWEGVPVPEVEEGDEIEPCPVVLGTPVLSDTETLHHGMVQLDWQDIEDAGWYAVQYYHVEDGEWLDLPAVGVDIAFHGSSAVVSNLHGLSWLRVRAMSCAGESEWSQIEQLFGTNASDWEGVPVPEVAEGDEIEPCSEDADTPDNSPATGAPTINGTAQVGETLTTNTSGVIDADGLSNVQYEYQWLADDSDIAGATNATYTLVTADEGKAIKVQVSFTDAADNEETLTSAAAAAVVAAVAQPTEPPDQPTGLDAAATHSQVVLTWDDPEDESITGYVILRRIPGVDPEGVFDVLVADTGTSATTYTDDTVSAETRYTYRIKAINGAGESERSRWYHIDVPAAPEPTVEPTVEPTPEQAIEPPAQPEGLTATASHDEVVLTWDDPDDDSITGYVILRRVRVNDVGGDFSVLVADTGTAALTYTDDTVAAGLTYTYRIKAINGAGTSERSRWYHIDVPAAPEPTVEPTVEPTPEQAIEPPAQPEGLTATASHDEVVLTWDDPDDDSITGYVILRRVRVNDVGGDFSVLVADTGTAALTYTDDTVAAGLTYTYRIKAINGYGVSERSRWYHIDVPAAPEATLVEGADADEQAAPQRRSEYVDAHNAGVHDLAELMDGTDPLDPDAWDTEEEEDERVAGEQGKSVGTQQNRSSHTVDICDRTPEIEAGLLAFIQQTDSSVTCSTVTAAQLANVDYLYIEDGYSSEEIVPSDFANLTGLIELSISGSRLLTTVSANAFSELTSLTNFENLGLSRNRIQSVHRDAFDGLTFSRVGSIDLRLNQIETLEPGTFDGVTGLERLNLSVNHIKAFEDGVFENLADLEELNISNNQLRAIDRDTFRGLSSLRDLTIVGGLLSTLHPDAFDHLSALERLNLHGNAITELPADIFADAPNSLWEIRLSDNELSSLDSETFANLTGVEILTLSYNELTSLPEDLFDGLTGMQQLSLNNNDFSSNSLPADVFAGLTGLQWLYLSSNGLTSLPEDLFDGLTGLQRLSLHRNGLTSLPEDLFDGLTALQQLYLNDNGLTSLPENLFDGLTSLQRLYLYDNGLTMLPSGIFEDPGSSLRWLLLSDNDFSSLPADVFEGLDGLQILYLHRAGLTTLDEDLFDPLDDSLLYLYLFGNDSTSLDEDLFAGLTGLQRLYLHDNSLASLDEDLFDGLTALQRLYLDGNDLTSLPEDLFDDLSSLQDLNLDANMLTALIADVFDGLDDSLTDLYLRDNSLTALPTGVFEGLTGLQRLDLSCNALTALGLDELDPFAGTLKYLDVGANSFTNPPTEAAVNAKLTAVEALYLTGSPPCLPAFDTGLSALSLSSGTLTPEFVAPGIPGASGYRAAVGSDVTELTITVAPKDPHASIEPAPPSPGVIYDDDLETSGLQVHLDNRSTVRWQVRAENGAATQIYNVSVYRDHPPGSVARLRSLELDGLTLAPEFGSTTYDYEVASPASATQTTVTAIPLDPDAEVAIMVNGVSAEDDGTVDISADTTTVTVKVTAEDGVSTQTYTLSVRDVTPPDDLPADATTTGTVEVDGSAVRGDIYKPEDETVTWTDDEGEEHEQIVYDFDTDWFAVELEQGKTYQIEMKGQILSSPGLDTPGEPVDTELTLSLPQINAIHGSNGDQLVNTFGRDESSAHHLFRVTFHVHKDDTYYIAASGESHEWGGYELTVIDITRDD